jgi:hypothetical protein
MASFSTALAQVAAPPPSALIVVQGRGLALEWGITILMIGLALFVVCRSSNRNSRETTPVATSCP